MASHRHDPELLERFANLPTTEFRGEAFRATRPSLHPLAPSTRGGRWLPPGTVGALYTSLNRDGAIAEIAHHWGLMTPPPTGPVVVHTLDVAIDRVIRLRPSDLEALGVAAAGYGQTNHPVTRTIGSAAAFIGLRGLIVPSARWTCEHLVLFCDPPDIVPDTVRATARETVDWRAWAESRCNPPQPA